jgi:hypothetical protein
MRTRLIGLTLAAAAAAALLAPHIAQASNASPTSNPLAAALTSAQTLGAKAAQDIPVQPQLQPPAGNALSAVFFAAGVQVYQCGNGTWSLLEPAAHLAGVTLADGAVRTAIHFRGPSWESTQDGSLVEAARVASSPVPGAVDELLLKATRNRGDGVFGQVTYVQRLATSGGVAPTGGCADGQTVGVPYSAQYRFFVPGS